MKPYQPMHTNSGYIDEDGKVVWETWACNLCGEKGSGKLPQRHLDEAKARTGGMMDTTIDGVTVDGA